MRVGLVFGGRSVEHQVSVRSARTVAEGLVAAGFDVVPFGIGADGGWLDSKTSASVLAAGEIDQLPSGGGSVLESLQVVVESRIDVVFPLVHGTWGEDGTLQGLCEMADLPYVGAGVTASAVAMDKLLTKRILERVDVPVVAYEAVSRAEFAAAERRSGALERCGRFDGPVFVKPSVGGSSVGVTRVESGARTEALERALEAAVQLDDNALVEAEIAGRELECAVLGYPELQASAVGEIRPAGEFYDYADKYLDDEAELILPADLEAGVRDSIRETAIRAFAAIGGTGMARVDFLLESNTQLFVNEINTVPGFTSISMYPKLWEISGFPLPELVSRLVEDARRRHADRSGIDRRIAGWLDAL